jgi:hypothetical protein
MSEHGLGGWMNEWMDGWMLYDVVLMDEGMKAKNQL